MAWPRARSCSETRESILLGKLITTAESDPKMSGLSLVEEQKDDIRAVGWVW